MRLQLDTSLAGPDGAAGLAAPLAPSNRRASGSSLQPGDFSASGDSASVSGPSSLLSRLASERAARIEQLSSAVRDGSYLIPSASIGRALVAEALA